MMKEALQSIYSVAQNVSQAEETLLRWEKIQSDQLHKMAMTTLQHWDGILEFWRFGNMANTSMEGFNNKVRTMLRQTYGYRDLDYMRLKIFNLPTTISKLSFEASFSHTAKEAEKRYIDLSHYDYPNIPSAYHFLDIILSKCKKRFSQLSPGTADLFCG